MKTEARQRLLADPHFPDDFVDPLLDTQERMLTEPVPLTTTVEDVTGHPARTFAEWARDHATEF